MGVTTWTMLMGGCWVVVVDATTTSDKGLLLLDSAVKVVVISVVLDVSNGSSVDEVVEISSSLSVVLAITKGLEVVVR
jgi:hypothetical protein